MKMLTKKEFESLENGSDVELTGRLIDNDARYEYPEWSETALHDGVEITIYYITTPEDEKMIEDFGGDWGALDWYERIERIEPVE